MTLVDDDLLECLTDLSESTRQLMIMAQNGECKIGAINSETLEQVTQRVAEIQESLAYIQYHEDNLENN